MRIHTVHVHVVIFDELGTWNFGRCSALLAPSNRRSLRATSTRNEVYGFVVQPAASVDVQILRAAQELALPSLCCQIFRESLRFVLDRMWKALSTRGDRSNVVEAHLIQAPSEGNRRVFSVGDDYSLRFHVNLSCRPQCFQVADDRDGSTAAIDMVGVLSLATVHLNASTVLGDTTANREKLGAVLVRLVLQIYSDGITGTSRWNYHFVKGHPFPDNHSLRECLLERLDNRADFPRAVDLGSRIVVVGEVKKAHDVSKALARHEAGPTT